MKTKLIKLSDIAEYSDSRIEIDKLNFNNYVTVDNLLQNKAGLTKSNNLPPTGTTTPSFKMNNILVGNIRPYLKKIWFADRDGGCSADVLVFDIKQNFDPKFIYYALYRDDFFLHMMKGSKGTKMPRGDKNQILEFLIPCFDFTVQQEISSVLSAFDSKIKLNNQINAELKALANTLYDYWFVQLDFPDKYDRPYKSSGGKMVWNEMLTRDVPEGWNVEKISSILKIGSGFPFDSNTYLKEGKYKIITIKNVQESKLEINSIDYIDVVPSNIPDFCLLELGDILISLTGNVGRICFVTDKNLLLNQRVGKFLCDLVYKNFMYLLFQRQEERIRLENISTGSSQKNLSPVDATNEYIAIPPTSILEKFNTFINNVIEKILANQIENNNLNELRNWLLPMLMNGQVTVKD